MREVRDSSCRGRHLTDDEPCDAGRVRPCLRGGRHRVRPSVEGVVGEAVVADLHVLAGLEAHLVDVVLAHIGAVEGPQVPHEEAVPVTDEGGMLARDGDVVEEDLAVGVPPGESGLGVQQEASTEVRALAHHQQRAVRGQVLDRADDPARETGLAVLDRITGRDRAQLRCVVEILVVPRGVTGHSAPLPGKRWTPLYERSGSSPAILHARRARCTDPHRPGEDLTIT